MYAFKSSNYYVSSFKKLAFSSGWGSSPSWLSPSCSGWASSPYGSKSPSFYLISVDNRFVCSFSFFLSLWLFCVFRLFFFKNSADSSFSAGVSSLASFASAGAAGTLSLPDSPSNAGCFPATAG